MGGDMQIVDTNGDAFALQKGSDLSVVEGGSGVVGEDVQTAAEILYRSKVLDRCCALLHAMQELREGNG
jgi:hypothetical protein